MAFLRFAFALPFLFSLQVFSQHLDAGKKYFFTAVAFWNVENLYDTLNDKWKNDEDFTPSGSNAWNGEKYRLKLDRLSEVIALLASDVTPEGPALMGFCEIENKSVMEDLVKMPRISKRNYKVVHIEGPDARGVDASFMYQPRYFKVL